MVGAGTGGRRPNLRGSSRRSDLRLGILPPVSSGESEPADLGCGRMSSLHVFFFLYSFLNLKSV